MNASLRGTSPDSGFGSLKGSLGELRSAFSMLDDAMDQFADNAGQRVGGLRNAFDQLQDAGTNTLDTLKDLKEFAGSSGFDFSAVVRAVEQFKALRLGAGQTIPFLRVVGKVVAQQGRGSLELERVSRALAEVSAKTRLYSEEINQLGNAGVPVWQILTDATGKSRDQLAKLVKEGKISSEMFLAAFRAFAGEIPDNVLRSSASLESFAHTAGDLEQRLKALNDRAFELGAASATGRTNIERFDYWVAGLEQSGRLTTVQLIQLKEALDKVRNAAGAVDMAEAAARRAATARGLEDSVTELNRGLLRQLVDLKVYAGAAKTPLDELLRNLEDMAPLKLAPGAFLPLIQLLDRLGVSSAEGVAANVVELAKAIHQILAAANPDIDPERLGALETHMVDALRRVYDVMANQLTPVQQERNRLEEEFQQLQNVVPIAAATAAEKYRNVWQAAVNDIQLADEMAVESQIRSQVKLADASIYHSTRANAKVLEFLAEQKNLTDIVADAKTGAIRTTFNGIDEALDRIVPKLHGFGEVLKGIIGDLLKLEISKSLRVLLGLGPQLGNSSNGGGGLWSNLKNVLGVGTRGSTPGGVGGGNLWGALKSILTPGTGTAAAGGTFGPALAGGLPGVMTGAGAASSSLVMTPGLASTLAAASAGVGGIAGVGGGGAAAAAGTAAGGIGGGAGAAGSGISMASLGAFLTNPFTIAAAGAVIGGFLLYRHFRNRTEKDLAKSIQQEYGINVKDMQVLRQVKELGEQSFGKSQVRKHLTDTIRLDSVKQLLQGYAEQTGQTSNRLMTNAQYQDANFKENNFVRRITGGPVPGITRGFDHVPILGDGGEYMLRSQVVSAQGISAINALNAGSAVVMPVPAARGPVPGPGGWRGLVSVDSRGRQTDAKRDEGVPHTLVAALVGAVERSNQTIERLEAKLKATRPGDVFSAAIDEDPHLGGKALNESANVSSGDLQAALKKMGFK